MIARKLVASLLNIPARWVDDSVPVETLRRHLVSGFETLARRAESQPDAFPPEVRADLRSAANCLLEAGLISDVPAALSGWSAALTADLTQAQAWADVLADGKIVTKEGFARGCGCMLDALDAQGSDSQRAFAGAALEKLLRHVEVKRKNCLSSVIPAANEEETALERERVAILFCRSARRRGDLRLLNAVFKLNDWSFPLFKRGGFAEGKFPVARQCCHLRALAEQEAAAKELLR